MDDTNSLIEQRRAKLKALEAKGIFPFKNKFSPTESCKYARDNYAEGREVAVAGRITAHREMGKSMFIDVRDQSGRLQIYAQKNHLEETAPGSWDIFTHLDLGDFIGARGKLFTTKTGEISIKLDSFVILAKALRPPPEKWHGLADTEIRYRQRYLDLMANPDVKEIFLKRSQIISEIRNFLHSRGFVEVETPMMQAIPGGAAAQPFKTHHNALGCDFYLRIALELYLKRLLVGGVDKVFEIGRNFRNEGLSRKHNPEFTMLEAYQAFGDYETMMELVESLIVHLAATVFPKNEMKFPCVRNGETQMEILQALVYCWTNLGRFIEAAQQTKSSEVSAAKSLLSELFALREKYGVACYNKPHWEIAQLALNEFAPLFERTVKILENWTDPEHPTGINSWTPQVQRHIAAIEKLTKVEIIDLSRPWRRAKYKDLVREKAGADWFETSPDERRRRAHSLGAKIANDYTDFEVTGAVFEKLIEPTLIQPTFVTHLPKELVPLAKLLPDDPTTVEVFECCINGQEISPGYTEQNDPIEQRERLEHQAGGEQQKLDEDFLVALEHGMPPAGGIGIGIDRLCMMLLGQESIRDVILFPQLKPK
ncbi:MAG TPA: lysine--tRNA ligase [Candidatus Aquilonibacter sp.]|nr:lysine--tRNA ligase [Candidatus Aquilonibacter sp.]